MTNLIRKIGTLTPRQLIIAGLFSLLFVVMVRTSWVSDDAYITFRTIDNFIQGRGLVWNPTDRVQVYTHPLWMFFLSFFHFITREVFFTTIAVSIFVSLGAVLLVVKKISASAKAAAIILSLLVTSKAFTDYATSGLENPLTNLLLALFAYLIFQERSQKNYFCLILVAALGSFNRIDTTVLFLPGVLFAFHQAVRGLGWKDAILLGFAGYSPFVLWELFSLFYYGFPFPNTAYAKLNTGIPAVDLIRQGAKYFANSLAWDPVTLLSIAGAIFLSFASKKKELIMLSLGILLYLAYILKVGGGFMSGRFFAAPFFLAVVIISTRIKSTFKPYVYLAIIPILVSLAFPLSPLKSGKNYGLSKSTIRRLADMEDGIADERAFYCMYTCLLNHDNFKESSQYKLGISLREHLGEQGRGARMAGAIGLLGYFAGPELVVLDYHALADPLLSRLPAMKVDTYWEFLTGLSTWRIGHFRRTYPPGYIDSFSMGQNTIKNPELRLYFEKLYIVVSDPLLAKGRMKEIILMNLGAYDHLLETYDPSTGKSHDDYFQEEYFEGYREWAVEKGYLEN